MAVCSLSDNCGVCFSMPVFLMKLLLASVAEETPGDYSLWKVCVGERSLMNCMSGATSSTWESGSPCIKDVRIEVPRS